MKKALLLLGLLLFQSVLAGEFDPLPRGQCAVCDVGYMRGEGYIFIIPICLIANMILCNPLMILIIIYLLILIGVFFYLWRKFKGV